MLHQMPPAWLLWFVVFVALQPLASAVSYLIIQLIRSIFKSWWLGYYLSRVGRPTKIAFGMILTGAFLLWLIARH